MAGADRAQPGLGRRRRDRHDQVRVRRLGRHGERGEPPRGRVAAGSHPRLGRAGHGPAGRYELEPRGTLEIKGKGPMATWFLGTRSTKPGASDDRGLTRHEFNLHPSVQLALNRRSSSVTPDPEPAPEDAAAEPGSELSWPGSCSARRIDRRRRSGSPEPSPPERGTRPAGRLTAVRGPQSAIVGASGQHLRTRGVPLRAIAWPPGNELGCRGRVRRDTGTNSRSTGGRLERSHSSARPALIRTNEGPREFAQDEEAARRARRAATRTSRKPPRPASPTAGRRRTRARRRAGRRPDTGDGRGRGRATAATMPTSPSDPRSSS